MKTSKFINSDMTEQRRSKIYGFKKFRKASKLPLGGGEILSQHFHEMEVFPPETNPGPTINRLRELRHI